MTDIERERVFENILKASGESSKPKTSPWVTFSFVTMLEKNRFVYYIVIPLIIIFSSSGVVFASQSSLPDSILYPFKVNIVEPLIERALTFSPKNKAKYEINLATKRLVEAETLAGLGKLDQINEDKINNLLDRHTTALDKALNDVKKTDNGEGSDKIVSNFNFEMNIHAQTLDNIKNRGEKNNRNKDQTTNDIKKIEKKSEANKDSSVQIDTKLDTQGVDSNTQADLLKTQPDSQNTNNQENQISKKARMNAYKINIMFKNKMNNNPANQDFQSKNRNNGGNNEGN